MGYIKHDAIVVTSWRKISLEKAYAIAKELGLHTTPIQDTVGFNGTLSFLICPDGSKEGWDASDEADTARAAWVDKVTALCSYQNVPVEKRNDVDILDWIHITFGGDDSSAAIVAVNPEEYDEEYEQQNT